MQVLISLQLVLALSALSTISPILIKASSSCVLPTTWSPTGASLNVSRESGSRRYFRQTTGKKYVSYMIHRLFCLLPKGNCAEALGGQVPGQP